MMWAAANPPLCTGSFSSFLMVLMERSLSSHLASLFPYPSLLNSTGITSTSTLPPPNVSHLLPRAPLFLHSPAQIPAARLQDRPNKDGLSLHLRAYCVPGTVTPHWVTAMSKTDTDMCSWSLCSSADRMPIGSTVPIPSRPDWILDLLCILPTSQGARRRTEP